jgi:hypothetical protein
MNPNWFLIFVTNLLKKIKSAWKHKKWHKLMDIDKYKRHTNKIRKDEGRSNAIDKL